MHQLNSRYSTKFSTSIRSILIVLLIGLMASASKVWADAEPILSITGNLEESADGKIQLYLDDLTALESTTIETDAPWTEGAQEYTGVRISTLLKSIGARSNQFEAIASNDYSFTLKNIDFDEYPIIIAYLKNGEKLDLRNLGPLLIMFPFDDYPELLTEQNKAASVWQLIKLNIL